MSSGLLMSATMRLRSDAKPGKSDRKFTTEKKKRGVVLKPDPDGAMQNLPLFITQSMNSKVKRGKDDEYQSGRQEVQINIKIDGSIRKATQPY